MLSPASEQPGSIAELALLQPGAVSDPVIQLTLTVLPINK